MGALALSFDLDQHLHESSNVEPELIQTWHDLVTSVQYLTTWLTETSTAAIESVRIVNERADEGHVWLYCIVRLKNATHSTLPQELSEFESRYGGCRLDRLAAEEILLARGGGWSVRPTSTWQPELVIRIRAAFSGLRQQMSLPNGSRHMAYVAQDAHNASFFESLASSLGLRSHRVTLRGAMECPPGSVAIIDRACLDASDETSAAAFESLPSPRIIVVHPVVAPEPSEPTISGPRFLRRPVTPNQLLRMIEDIDRQQERTPE